MKSSQYPAQDLRRRALANDFSWRRSAENYQELYRWAVRRTDAVVVQTARQFQACRAVFGREARHIASCHPKEAASGQPSGDILWVGTVKPLKRPELLLELARTHEGFVTIEDNVVAGGAGSGVSELLNAEGVLMPLLQLGLPDAFQHHASREDLLAEAGIDAVGIRAAVLRRWPQLAKAEGSLPRVAGA